MKETIQKRGLAAATQAVNEEAMVKAGVGGIVPPQADAAKATLLTSIQTTIHQADQITVQPQS